MIDLQRPGNSSGKRAVVAAAAAAALIAGAVLGLAGPSADAGAAGARAAAAAPSPRNVTLLLDWVPNPDHVGIYWAQEHGLFAARGLKVSLKAPSDPSAPIRLVGVGKADLAISYEPELFFAAQKKLPVVAVAAVVPQPLNSLIALAGSGIASAADLRGRKVGVTGIPTDGAILQTVVRHAGLAPADVQTVTVGFSLLPALLSRKVDAIVGGFRNVEAIQLAQETGRAPLAIPADRLGVPRYDELVLVANANRLRSDAGYRAAVRGVAAALVAGTRAARADAAAATALMAKVTEYKPAFLRASVPATLQLLAPPGGLAVGCLDPAAWQRYGDWMLKTGLLRARVDASTVVTEAYLPRPCRGT